MYGCLGSLVCSVLMFVAGARPVDLSNVSTAPMPEPVFEVFVGFNKGVSKVAIVDDAPFLVISLAQQTQVWDITSKQLQHETEKRERLIPGGSWFGLANGTRINFFQPPQWESPFQTIQFEAGSSQSVYRRDYAISPDRSVLALSTYQNLSANDLVGWVEIYNLTSFQKVGRLAERRLAQYGPLAVVTQRSTLLALSAPGAANVKILDLGRGNLVTSLEPRANPNNMMSLPRVKDLVGSANGQWLAAVYNDSTVRIWQLNSFEVIASFGFSSWPGNWTLAFSPDDQYLLALISNRLVIWETRDWQPVAVFEGEFQERAGIAFSSDQRYLAFQLDDWKPEERPLYKRQQNFVRVFEWTRLLSAGQR